MINNNLKADAVAGTLPKRTFNKFRVYYIKDNINLYYFLSWYNSDLFYCEPSQYRLRKHKTLCVGRYKSYAHDFATGRTYDFYSFCKEFLGLSFYSALYLGNEFMNQELSKKNLSVNKSTTTVESIEDKIQTRKYYINRANSKPWGYLCTTRKIDRSVVSYLYDKELLYLQDFGQAVNCCFAFECNDGSEYNERVCGFEIVGTYSSVRYKSVVSALQDSYFSFKKYYDSESGDTALLCFESVIDLLSFVTLVETGKVDIQNRSLILISIRGLCPNIVYKAESEFDISYKNVYFFTDNDDESKKFCDSFSSRYDNSKKSIEFLYNLDCKDWNDVLFKVFEPVKLNDIINYCYLPW